MKYTREQFISLMAKMQDKHCSANRVAGDLSEALSCEVGAEFLDNIGFYWYMDYLVETLEKMFAEEISYKDPDVISWFVYENNFGRDGLQYDSDFPIETAGDLYDYMMRG